MKKPNPNPEPFSTRIRGMLEVAVVNQMQTVLAKQEQIKADGIGSPREEIISLNYLLKLTYELGEVHDPLRLDMGVADPSLPYMWE